MPVVKIGSGAQTQAITAREEGRETDLVVRSILHFCQFCQWSGGEKVSETCCFRLLLLFSGAIQMVLWIRSHLRTRGHYGKLCEQWVVKAPIHLKHFLQQNIE